MIKITAYLFVIILLAEPLMALPRFFPVSQGRFADELVELNEVDQRLAKMDEQILLVQELNVAAFKALGVDTTKIEIYGQLNEQTNAEILKDLEAKGEAYKEYRDSMDNGAGLLISAFKAITTGDPTALLALLSGALGIGCEVNRRKKNKHRKDAIDYAKMGEESKQKIIDNKDYPEVT